jgi:hypothetical protein
MKSENTAVKTYKRAVVLAAVALHPVVLFLLHPHIGERCNLSVFLAPVAAVWFLSLRVGIGVMVFNALISGFFFATQTGAAPGDGIPKSLMTVLIGSALCFGLDFMKRYLDKGRAMADELERIRNSRRN